MTQASQHVGFTRSGKAVQVPIFSDEPKPVLPPACALFTPADHFDAHAVFEYLISRELSRGATDTRALLTYDQMSTAHKSKLDAEWLQAERLALSLATIFAILDHGKSLADRIFQD
ncbi:MAG: hypothetical protein NTY08_15365 [Proteobacteria bacterium]|jgi:hypothetical protein|nr:hypothetical protein [Pseudomonadota bacterium]